jgi:branched-chain amino acid transport system permease protein
MGFENIKPTVPLLSGIALSLCFPLVFKDPYILSLIIPGLIWSVSCMGWNVIVRTGQFSMGQAAFMAIGGYVSALLCINLNISVWIAMLVGGLVSAFIAFLVGVVVLRLGGIYFAIVTLAFGEVIRVIAINLTEITKGSYGLIPPAPTISLGSFTINFAVSKVPYYYLALLIVIISGLVFWRVDQSRLGRIYRSIASNSTLSEHLGMRLMKYRVMAFTIAGFFTGVAGALYCHYLFFVGPTLFALSESIMILIMCTVGGISSAVVGPILGALVLSASGDYLSTLLRGAKPLVFGALVVTIVFFYPGGVVEAMRSVWRKLISHHTNESMKP